VAPVVAGPGAPPQHPDPEAPLPDWVTGAVGTAPQAAPDPLAFSDEPDGDTTIERAMVRGYLPPPTARPADVAVEPAGEPRAGGRALAVVAGLVAVAALAATAFVLTSRNEGDDAGGDPEPPGTPSTSLAVPAGLTAVESPAGVQLDWDGADDDTYAVLMMSEIADPQVLPVDSGTSMLVPSTSLDADDGYCFAVAYLSSLEAASPNTEEAFGPPVCIRGASEDTVRPG
jgi:hypothetical protein